MSNPSPILSPGDRLLSKNSYSVVQIKGATPSGYRGTAFFKDSFGSIDSCGVFVGLRWESSYTQLPTKQGGYPIPIKSQVPDNPTPNGKKGADWFEEVKELIENGWTIREACKDCHVSPNTYRARLTQEQNESMDKEFYEC